MGRATPHSRLLLVGLLGSLVMGGWASSAQGAELSPSQAKKASRAAVQADDSYKRIDSPYKLKVRSCTVREGSASCLLYRSVSQSCRLDGPVAPGRVCAQVVGHRVWTVEVEASDAGAQASIEQVRDVSGKFEPSDPAAQARRRL